MCWRNNSLVRGRPRADEFRSLRADERAARSPQLAPPPGACKLAGRQLQRQERDRLRALVDALPTDDTTYAVSDSALIIKGSGAEDTPKQLAWVQTSDQTTICWVIEADVSFASYRVLFGNDPFPAFAYHGIHPTLLAAWQICGVGGAGFVQNGVHHRHRGLIRYTRACARNLEAKQARRAAARRRRNNRLRRFR